MKQPRAPIRNALTKVTTEETVMTDTKRQLNLNLFVYPGGHHEAAWRYKGSDPKRITDIAYYQELARRAEAAKFDALFFC